MFSVNMIWNGTCNNEKWFNLAHLPSEFMLLCIPGLVSALLLLTHCSRPQTTTNINVCVKLTCLINLVPLFSFTSLEFHKRSVSSYQVISTNWRRLQQSASDQCSTVQDSKPSPTSQAIHIFTKEPVVSTGPEVQKTATLKGGSDKFYSDIFILMGVVLNSLITPFIFEYFG